MTSPGPAPEVGSCPGTATTGSPEWGAVLGWLLVAGVSRFGLLGEWSLWGDEAYTLIDVESLQEGVWRESVRTWPMFFLLELPFYAALKGWLGVEAAARFLPALCASLVPAVLFVGTRPFLQRTERHLVAGLITCSPWLLFHAQFARHYAPLLLVCCVAFLQFLKALREDRPASMWWACGWFLLAGLVHPTAWSLFAGCLLVAFLAPGLPQRPSPGTRRPLWILLGLLLLAFVVGQESVRNTVGYKLNHRDAGAETLPDLVMGIGYNLGIPVCLLAALGLPLLWKRDRFLAGAIVLIAGPTLLGLLGLAAAGTWVEQRYWIPIVPLLFLPAAVLLAALMRGVGSQGRALALAPPALALAAYLPGFVSHYLDGDRPDLREAVAYVSEHLGEGEFVVTENNVLFRRYAPEVAREDIHEAPPRPGDGLSEFRRAMRDARGLWVILPDSFQKAGGARSEFHQWSRSQGRLQRVFHVPRLDYHQNRISVFYVDPAKAERYRTSESR